MSNNFRFNQFRIPLFLLLLCIVAYFPLSSFQFGLKNDAFIFNFPNKHFFSESIHAGVLPTWNPYLNFGFPLYADPGFAWWQPITWIFGIIGYNAYTFTIEVLLYIYLAGLGMYWLGRKLNLSQTTSTALAIMFMCSGFFIGNLQHINYLTCSAFIPWFVGAWILYQRTPKFKNLLGCCVAAYLLCSGGHPAIPIAASMFFLIIILLYPIFNRTENLRQYFLNHVKLLAGTILFLLPLLISYLILLPYFSRVGPVDQQQHNLTGFTLPSYISFLFPFGTIKNPDWFHTDVSMRNGYFSIPGFIFFIVFLFRRNKNYLQLSFLIAGLAMLLFSAGGITKSLIYDSLPIFSWIKTNGEFRVFVIFSLLFCAGFELEKFFSGEERNRFLFRRITIISLIILIFIMLTLVISGLGKFSFSGASITERVKYFIDNVSFNQSLFIAALVTALFCIGYLLVLKKKRNFFIALLVADVVINCWLLLPVTGVGRTGLSDIQKLISKNPAGFPLPELNQNKTAVPNPEEEKVIGNSNWYKKQIVHSRIEYPSLLKSSELFYITSDITIFFNKPFAFLKNENSGVRVTRFLPNRFTFQVSATMLDTMIVLQNYFPGWVAKVDGKKVAVEKSSQGFLTIPIKPSGKIVELKFHAVGFN